MFEVQTYDVILARLLKRLPENEDIRPSSPLYIAVGPAAKEFETVYGELDYTLDQVFPTTANRDYLIKEAATYRISPYPATKAVIEGKFDVEVEIGTEFSTDGIEFSVIAPITKDSEDGYYYYELECEETGTIGNVLSGKLLPIRSVPDLKYAYITKILIPGEEEEETEAFRERFLASFNSKAYGGNLADYLEKVTAIDGVGRAKILRCVDFEGNSNPEWVGVVIMDSQGKKPSDELVDSVQQELMPLGKNEIPTPEMTGLGLAPIGHLVHVRGVKEETIDIGLKLTLEPEHTWESLKNEIEEKVSDYITSEALKWGDTYANSYAATPQKTHVSIVRARIESLLLEIDGVLDANDTLINGEFENYDLEWDAVPVLGRVYQHSDTDIRGGINTCPYNCPDCTYQRDISLCQRVLEGLDG